MAAILRLGADPADVRAAFGAIQGNARKINAQMNRDSRAASAEHVRTLRQEQAESYRSANASLRARQQAEREATKVTETEERKREAAHASAFARAKSTRDRYYKGLEDAERSATRVSERESVARTRSQAREHAQRLAAARRVAGAAVGAAVNVGGTLHGMIQGSRERRAATDRTARNALYQAGANAFDGAMETRQIHQYALAHGLDSAEVASGLEVGQREFNILGNSRSTREERQANLNRALEMSRFARDTGQDTREVMRLGGMMAQPEMHMTEAMQRNTMYALTGFAQHGAIELGAISSTGMSAIQQRVQQSLIGVDPNDAQAQGNATQRAVMSAVAEMEVGRSAGRTPRQVGRVTAQMADSLQSDATQNRMLNNLQHAGATAAIERLYATDSHGRRRLRGEYQSTTGLAQGLTEAGMTSTQMRNAFAGSGHGNAQSMRTNERDMLALFMGEGNERLQTMMRGAGTHFTVADRKRGAEMFGSDEQTALIRNREAQEEALVGNTNALTSLSNSITAWTSANPIAAGVAGATGPSAVKGLFGAGGASGVATGVAATGGVGAMIGAILAGAVGMDTGSKLAGLADLASGNRHATGQATSAGNEMTLARAIRELPSAIAEAMRSVSVEPSPHMAEHSLQLARANATHAANKDGFTR